MRQLTLTPLNSLLIQAKKKFETGSENPKLPIGLKSIDELTRGYRTGKITVIGARTSEGKTAFAINSALSLANSGKSVLYISLEDDVISLAQRILCNLTGTSFDWLDRGYKLENHKFEYAKDAVKNMSFLIIDEYGYNFEEIGEFVESIQEPPEIIFIDYIQMIDVNIKMSRYEAISRFMRDAKVFCIKKNLAFVILCQIGRAAKDKERPMLHHLKEAGTIEEVADLVMILRYVDRWSNEDTASPEDFEVDVAKNKTGRLGIKHIRFIAPEMRFEDWPLKEGKP